MVNAAHIALGTFVGIPLIVVFSIAPKFKKWFPRELCLLTLAYATLVIPVTLEGHSYAHPDLTWHKVVRNV